MWFITCNFSVNALSGLPIAQVKFTGLQVKGVVVTSGEEQVEILFGNGFRNAAPVLHS